MARVLINGPGMMRYNTYAVEQLIRTGIPYRIEGEWIKIPLPEIPETFEGPSWAARVLLADIEPAWNIDRQLRVERDLTLENMAELLEL